MTKLEELFEKIFKKFGTGFTHKQEDTEDDSYLWKGMLVFPGLNNQKDQHYVIQLLRDPCPDKMEIRFHMVEEQPQKKYKELFRISFEKPEATNATEQFIFHNITLNTLAKIFQDKMQQEEDRAMKILINFIHENQ